MKTLASNYLASLNAAALANATDRAALNGMTLDQVAAAGVLAGYPSAAAVAGAGAILSGKETALPALTRIAALEWRDEPQPETVARIAGAILA